MAAEAVPNSVKKYCHDWQHIDDIFSKMDMLLYRLTKSFQTEDEFTACMKLLQNVVNKLVLHPLNQHDKHNDDASKYRMLNVNNNEIKQIVFKHDACLDLLLLIGFVMRSISTERYLVLPEQNENADLFQSLLVKINNCQPPRFVISEMKQDNDALSITIKLENTPRKCIFTTSTQIEDIDDDDFQELIHFIQQKFNTTADAENILLYEREEKSDDVLEIESGDDLQTFLESQQEEYEQHHTDLVLYVQLKCLMHAQKCCIVFIGGTGSGKSTIIKLLSGDQRVKTSEDVESCTEEITLIQSIFDSNTYFLDTVGTGDSKGIMNDTQILKKAFKQLYDKNISDIKIVWCVKGDTSKKEAHFSQKAEFISNLQINNDQIDDDKKDFEFASIWNSCIMVKKEGGSKTDNIEGVIAAAKDHGAQKEILKDNFFGFKCSEFTKYGYDSLVYIPPQQQKELGHFKPNEAKEVIENKLSAISSFKLWFKNEECTKCGCKGDSRYIDATCHTDKVASHDEAISFRHIGAEIPYHSGNVGAETIIKHIHGGYIKKKHSDGVERYHDGEKRILKSGLYTAVGGGAGIGGSYGGLVGGPIGAGIGAGLGGLHGLAVGMWKPRYWWTCCDGIDGTDRPCKTRYRCCKQHTSATECSLANAMEVWSCCNQQTSADGCTAVNEVSQIWTCCDQPMSSDGCRKKWDCCNGIGQGCEAYFPCCDGLKDSIGCCTKCSNCRQKWGTNPGCIVVNK